MANQLTKSQLANLTCWIFGFVTGVAVGSLSTSLLTHIKSRNNRRPELVDARQRILAGVKQQHEQDIRREIFQTTEALRGELKKSLHRLVNLTERVLEQVHEESQANSQEKDLDTARTGGGPTDSLPRG
jgi:gas vesicle protein